MFVNPGMALQQAHSLLTSSLAHSRMLVALPAPPGAPPQASLGSLMATLYKYTTVQLACAALKAATPPRSAGARLARLPTRPA